MNNLQSPTWLLYSANPHQIAPTRAYTYTRFTALSIVQCLLDFADVQLTMETDESLSNVLGLYMNAETFMSKIQDIFRDFVTDSNPRLAAMRQYAQNNISKLRSGLNIPGKLRPVPGSSFQPTAYRYSALMDRAKQLVGLAQQVENSCLAQIKDVEFNPYRSINCQARSCALFLSLIQRHVPDDAIHSPIDFLRVLNNSRYRPQLQNSDLAQKNLFGPI